MGCVRHVTTRRTATRAAPQLKLAGRSGWEAWSAVFALTTPTPSAHAPDTAHSPQLPHRS
jgi:hypothetical protein